MCSDFQSRTVLSMMPELLLDLDKILHTSRQLKLDRCNSTSKICSQHILRLNELDHQYSEIEKKQEHKLKTLITDVNNIKQKVFEKENEIDVLRSKIQVAKGLLKNTVLNVPDEEELSILMNKVCTLQNGIELEKKLFKQELAQYQRGIFYYKKYFLCNVIHVPKDTLIFTLNTSAKTSSDTSEFVKFTTKDNGNTFQYVEMQPKLKIEQLLVKRYQETSDVQGFILSYWKAVKALKERKVLAEKN